MRYKLKFELSERKLTNDDILLIPIQKECCPFADKLLAVNSTGWTILNVIRKSVQNGASLSECMLAIHKKYKTSGKSNVEQEEEATSFLRHLTELDVIETV